jgi:AraC-like DNA-binding protein
MRVSADGNPDVALAQRNCRDTVCSRVVQPLASVLRFSGIEPDGVLAPCGVIDAAEHEERIERHAWYEVLDRSLDLTGDPRIGLRWAKIAAAKGGAMGLVEYLARSSASLREAISSLVHYGRVFQDDLAFESVSEGRSVCLRLVSRDNARLPALWAEGILAYWYLVGVRLANFDTSFARSGTEIMFAHATPVNRTTYQRFFKCPVHFNAPEYAIVFASELLDVPLVTSDPCLFTLLENYARQLLVQMPCAGGDVQQRVRSVLLRELDGGNPTKEYVASSLRLSPRTLTRRLADAGTTFEEVLSSLRHELSARYLRDTELSISEIALALGFSGASSFVRAFRRWTGSSPSEVRAGAGRLVPRAVAAN